MARFIIRSLVSTVITLIIVSIALFLLLEVGSGDITVKILGVFSTPEQRASYRNQLGLDDPVYLRYIDWLIGNEWRAEGEVGFNLVTAPNPQTGEDTWWADVDGQLTRWSLEEGELTKYTRQEDGSTVASPAEAVWAVDENGQESFWGVDDKNNAVKWVRGEET
ncbi:MAG: ABC transporter permease, partial [Anaerolineae bacterium]|nr:ABC transporter permease [Anaerolineae bacterium]